MGNLWGDDYSDLHPPRRTWGQWLAGFFFATGGAVEDPSKWSSHPDFISAHAARKRESIIYVKPTPTYPVRLVRHDSYAVNSGYTFKDARRAAGYAFAEDVVRLTGLPGTTLEDIRRNDQMPLFYGNAHLILAAAQKCIDTCAPHPDKEFD